MISKKLEAEARQICRLYKVRLYLKKFDKTDDAWGRACIETGCISINMKGRWRRADFFSILFHEVGHIVLSREGKWPAYHWTIAKVRMSPAEKRAVILTGYKAERYVDEWGKKTMRKHYPKLRFKAYYNGDQESREWLNSDYLSQFRDQRKPENR